MHSIRYALYTIRILDGAGRGLAVNTDSRARARLMTKAGARTAGFAKTPDSEYACYEIAHGEQCRCCGISAKFRGAHGLRRVNTP